MTSHQVGSGHFAPPRNNNNNVLQILMKMTTTIGKHANINPNLNDYKNPSTITPI